jgi:HEAT repeat protein
LDKAVTELIAALKDQDAYVRGVAALSLGSIGPEAKEAAPALLAALKDGDSGVRRSAANALRKIQAVGKS